MANRLRNYVLMFALTVCSVAILIAAGGYYLLATPKGARMLVNYAVLQSAKYASVSFSSLEGSIAEEVIIKGLVIKNWPLLGPSSTVLAQRVDLKAPNLDWRKINFNVFNGRLDLPDCDPILFTGTYSDGKIKGTVTSNAVDVSVVTKPFIPEQYWRVLHGMTSSVDFELSGPALSPLVEGHFYVEHIQYADRTVREGLARVNLVFSRKAGQWQMQGPVVLESGLVNEHSSIIELSKSKVVFNGDIMDPDLFIYGTAHKDMYIIDIALTGTLRKPVLHVYADPYLSEDEALLVLGLGNWAPSDFGLQYNQDVKKLGIKKKILDELNIGFEVEQLPEGFGHSQTGYSQTLLGEMPITDKLSVNVAEKLSPYRNRNNKYSPNDTRPQGESRMYLKYKNTF